MKFHDDMKSIMTLLKEHKFKSIYVLNILKSYFCFNSKLEGKVEIRVSTKTLGVTVGGILMCLPNTYLPTARLDLFLLSIVLIEKRNKTKFLYLEIIVRSLQLFWCSIEAGPHS